MCGRRRRRRRQRSSAWLSCRPRHARVADDESEYQHAVKAKAVMLGRIEHHGDAAHAEARRGQGQGTQENQESSKAARQARSSETRGSGPAAVWFEVLPPSLDALREPMYVSHECGWEGRCVVTVVDTELRH